MNNVKIANKINKIDFKVTENLCADPKWLKRSRMPEETDNHLFKWDIWTGSSFSQTKNQEPTVD